MLHSSLKPEGYLVKGPKLHLHYVIRNGVVTGLKKKQHKRSQLSDYDGEILSQVKPKFW